MESELSRRIAEALGWCWFNYETGMYATAEEDIADAMNNDGYTLEGWDDNREAWEFDALKPEIFWPEFEKWINAGERSWSAGKFTHLDGHYFFVEAYGIFGGSTYQCWQRIGVGESLVSLLEAGCKAWLAALEAGREKK